MRFTEIQNEIQNEFSDLLNFSDFSEDQLISKETSLEQEIVQTKDCLDKISQIIKNFEDRKNQLNWLQDVLQGLLNKRDLIRSKSMGKKGKNIMKTEESRHERCVSFDSKKEKKIPECYKHQKYYKFDSEKANSKQIELFSYVIYLK